MEDQRFDQMTRRLVTPVSRRQAFKVIAAAALGGLFIKSGSGAAFAEAGGNSACAHFCNDTFPPGPDRGECKSDAAHGTGTCATCGPAAPAGHPDVCAVGTSGAGCCPAKAPNCCNNTTCVNLQTDVNNCGSCGNVCAKGEVCQGGHCVNVGCPTTTPACCAAGGGTCTPFISCQNMPGCLCETTMEGTVACIVPVCTGRTCTMSTDCNPNEVCFVSGLSCCGTGSFCIPKCVS